MLELPPFFSIEDFVRSSEFVCEMVADYGSIRGSQTEDREDLAISYYLELLKNYELHEMCSLCFREIIISCDGRSSDIAELVCSEGNRYIAPTAHDVAYHHLYYIFAGTARVCQAYGEDVSNDLVKGKLSDIQEFISDKDEKIEHDDKLRLLSRIERERALVLRDYKGASPRTKRKMINSIEIRKAVSAADGLEDIYTSSWLTGQKKAGNWPNENSGGGNRRHSWDYSILLPFLRESFPQVDWENI